MVTAIKDRLLDLRESAKEDTGIVVLLSGGIDSSTLLYLLDREYDCYPLTILYGQKHFREVKAAEIICKSLGLQDRYKVVDLSELKSILPSALTSDSAEIPEGHYEDESMKQTVVPNRNMIFLSVAGGYAQGLGLKLVAYAPHKGDHAIYPDCRPEFIESASRTMQLGTGWKPDEGVKLLTPLSDYTKAKIVELGFRLLVPFESTWSCYKGGVFHCGRCGTCVERKEAFKLADIFDSTIYE